MGKKVLAVVILETFFCNFVLFSVKINVWNFWRNTRFDSCITLFIHFTNTCTFVLLHCTMKGILSKFKVV